MVRVTKKKRGKSPLKTKTLPKNIKEFPFNRFIPNLITLSTICAGLSAIRFGLFHQWEQAIFAIVVAAILDGVDGRIARFLGASSRFGAELDSLADFCNFGVSPALLIYLYQFEHLDRFGWLVSLFFTICMALRLARFNAFLDEAPPPLFATGKFFMGIPAPAGGLLVCLPIMIDLQFSPLRVPATLHIILALAVAFMMISRVPTFSFKKATISRSLVLPTFMTVGIVIAGFVTTPWLILIVLSFLYIGLIPFSIRTYKLLEKDLLSAS